MLRHRILTGASWLVPAAVRREWLEEWRAELWQLERLPRSGAYPSPTAFALGAVPHAFWERTEDWKMDGIRQDLKFGARTMRRNVGFTTVAALTLALGIGANASIFSLVNGVLLRPPSGIVEPDRLVQVARSYESAPRWDNFSWPAVDLIRESTGDVFAGVGAFSAAGATIGRGADTGQVLGHFVSGDFFRVMGVRPLAGRLLDDRDDGEPAAHRVVVLSHRLWQERFGGTVDAVGELLAIGNEDFEVVGVAPEGFQGPSTVGARPDLWLPLQHRRGAGEMRTEWGASWIYPIARLADGVSYERAETAMTVVSSRLREVSETNEDMQVLLAPGVGLDPRERAQGRQMSMFLFVIVALVLLVTCTNVANLFLARATGRQGEVSVRLALGAGKNRVVRQLLTENLLVAILATLLAVPLVLAAESFLPLLFPWDLTVSLAADRTVWIFLATIGLGTGFLFGGAPAWIAARTGLAPALRTAGATHGSGRSLFRDGLVVLQLALCLGLISGSVLLGRSVQNVARAQPGFVSEGLSAFPLALMTTGRYEDPATAQTLFDQVQEQVVGLPGVERVTVANQLPIAGGHARSTVRPADQEDVNFEAEYIVIGNRYFETLGVPIVSGRAIEGASEKEPAVVVNQALAHLFWPGEDPVGKQLDRGDRQFRVVGMSADVQMRSLRRDANPAVYYPMSIEPSPYMLVHASSGGSAPPDAASFRAAVARVDPALPVSQVVDLRRAVLDSLSESRTIGYLVGAFAVLALLLAGVGLYGVVSYAVAQRTRELGIRIALGARPENLMALVLSRCALLSVLGVVFGLGVSRALGAALQSLLFGVGPGDPVVLALAAGVLVTVVLVAASLPARRATRVDAAITLRSGD